jgi:transposase
MEAYSLDLRKRVVRACEEELLTREEIAEHFDVSRSFVQKLLRRYRTTGSLAAKPHSGGSSAKMDERSRRQVQDLVKQRSDATLQELCQQLKAAAGPQVSVPTMCRTLQGLNLPLKKSPYMPASVTRHA